MNAGVGDSSSLPTYGSSHEGNSAPPTRGRPPAPVTAEKIGLLESKLRQALDSAAFESPVVRVSSGVYQFGSAVRAFVNLREDGEAEASYDGSTFMPLDDFISSVSKRGRQASIPTPPQAARSQAPAAAVPGAQVTMAAAITAVSKSQSELGGSAHPGHSRSSPSTAYPGDERGRMGRNSVDTQRSPSPQGETNNLGIRPGGRTMSAPTRRDILSSQSALSTSGSTG